MTPKYQKIFLYFIKENLFYETLSCIKFYKYLLGK